MRRLGVLAAILLLAACCPILGTRGPALSCEQIAGLQQRIGMVASPEQLREILHEEYELPMVRIGVRPVDKVTGDGIATIVSWTDKRKLEYMAYLSSQGVMRMRVWQANTPGDRLLACLGQPTHYYAETSWVETGPVRDLYLFFPTQGTMAVGRQTFRGDTDIKLIPVVDGQFPFKDLMIVQPQSVEQVTNIGWGDYGPEILKQLKPWPGDWARIEFPLYPK